LYPVFQPASEQTSETVLLTVDEYETVRLIDFEQKTHIQCAMQMDISRTTVTEIHASALYKIADCIIHGKQLVISGGHYRICEGTAISCCGQKCCHFSTSQKQNQENQKGEKTMKIAVTYENGEVFQHFGHTSQFKLYDVAEGTVTKEEIVSTNGSGHGALAGFLKEYQVETVICGGIGKGAQEALAEAGIQLFGGVKGNADDAVKALLADNLTYDNETVCAHHGHGEHHHCREEKNGCSGHGM